MAKKLLEQQNLSFEERRIDGNVDGFKEQHPGVKTVPYIIVNGMPIGGYTELVEKINEEGENFGKRVLYG